MRDRRFRDSGGSAVTIHQRDRTENERVKIADLLDRLGTPIFIERASAQLKQAQPFCRSVEFDLKLI